MLQWKSIPHYFVEVSCKVNKIMIYLLRQLRSSRSGCCRIEPYLILIIIPLIVCVSCSKSIFNLLCYKSDSFPVPRFRIHFWLSRIINQTIITLSVKSYMNSFETSQEITFYLAYDYVSNYHKLIDKRIIYIYIYKQTITYICVFIIHTSDFVTYCKKRILFNTLIIAQPTIQISICWY